MYTNLEVTFQLHGHYAGRTVKLGKHQFVNGRVTYKGSPEDMLLLGRSLERNWCALPVGDPRFDKESDHGKRGVQKDEKQSDGQQPVLGDVQPDGEGAQAGDAADNGSGAGEAATGSAGTVPTGDGSQEGVNLKLQKALKKLDPKDDTHWTKDGKPALSAVEKLYGASDFARSDVELAAPGLKRAKEST